MKLRFNPYLILRSWLEKRKAIKDDKRIASLKARIEEWRNEEWKMTCLGDGTDENGNFFSFYKYEHKDGRTAIEWSDGTCSDADLKSFLNSRKLRRGN